MGNSKPMVGARVDPDLKQWIEKEAKRRDRPKAYTVRELLESGKESRERESSEEALPA